MVSGEWGKRRAPVGRGGPQYGHVDTTRNRAAPEVELALIEIDFMDVADGWRGCCPPYVPYFENIGFNGKTPMRTEKNRG